MKRIFLLFAFALGISVWGWGQTTFSWNFGTSSGNAAPSSGSLANLTVGNVSIGNVNGTVTMLSTTSASSGYTGASGQFNAGNAARVGALNTGSSGSAYFEFTLTPASGYTFTLGSISFGTRSTSTAPVAYTLRSSKDSYASDIATGSITANSTWQLKTNTELSFSSNSGTAVTFRLYGYNGSGSPGANTINWRIDDLSITITLSGGSTPLISVTPSTLSDFTYVEGSGPSASKNFDISGENLTHNIYIAASSNYEISLDDSDFSESPIILTQSGGSVSSTTIYVRLKAGLSAGSYNSEDITASSTGADNKTVSCSGSVSPPPDPEPSGHATGFGATANSHSQITMTWVDATGAQLPDAYLVKAAVAPATPTAPADGTPESNGTLVKNINFGVEEAAFTGLEPGTTYNFAIWPYTNEGSSIDYKTDGTVPDASATTDPLPWIEDFETGTKGSYAVGDVTCTKGSWNLAEAVIGNLANDKKNGAQSVRMRYSSETVFGIMTMNFDKTNGAGTVTVQHAKYGTDADGSWKLQMSADAGSTWTDVGSTIYTTNTALAAQEFEVNHPGNVRFKIIQLSGDRINIDDILITDYEVATFTGTGAWTETARWSTGQVPGSSDEVLIHGDCNIAGSTTVGTIYLGYGYSLWISTTGSLTVNTKFVINDAFFIYSTASGTGSLIVNGSVSGSGKAYIERYLTKYDAQGDNKYHFISSPVTAQPIQPEFVANPPELDEDFYYFDETQYLWINSKTETNVWNAGFENNFVVGKGYMASYPVNGSKLFEGTLNNDASYVLTCTHTTDQGKGWNLLGNPYQAAIDWDAVTLGDGMDNALYYYDSQNEKYRYYISYPGINNENYLGSGSRYIPPMQGFMVHAKSTGTKTVTIEKADLAHEAQTTFYKSGYNLVPGSMALTLISGERRDEAFVHFTSGATEAFDGQYDAYKLLSGNAGIPEIYTTNSGNVKFAINGLPELSGQTEVPVSIKANQPGVYTISADLSNLPATAYLNDLKTGAVHNLSQNPVYTFTAAEGDAPNRFKLTFGSVGSIEWPTSHPSVYYASGALHFVNAPAEKHLEVFNLAGQSVIFAKTLADVYPVALSAGIYIVKMTTAQQTLRIKIIVK